MNGVKTLSGKTIVVGVTGSIAAVEMVKVIHALRRRGAEVRAVMSDAACGIVSPEALAYATGHPVITKISGLVEHVGLCGDGGNADLLLIAPCTANTLGKIACGIDDTPVTTFATTALGRGMPVVIVPAMHHSMYRHPGVTANLERLKGWGIAVIGPVIEEGKAKIAGPAEIVLACERALSGLPLAGKKVLITSGPCRERVDDVRVLTTRSSGLMGRELALEAYRLGAEVTVIHRDRLPCVKNIVTDSAAEMRDAVHRFLSEDGCDIYISAAAISDFAPMPVEGKIRSGKRQAIELSPLPKLLDEVLAASPRPFTVAFKLGSDTEIEARHMLKRGAAVVVTNAPETMGSERGSYVLISGAGSLALSGTKEEIAHGIWAALLEANAGS
ncbi:MAG TPA: bifunctional phosphopantothenoylcysteine decarboxylase/phosphopantothenate--cysteine ligase CoaBC [Methanoregulaceae archaeon]|nr:bifunctional phosphopantothenoylcysteine decarboxylase/phosphopantothenate--cysteine ligase CoaBC [Methanoregulaceae archaeon]HPD75350.1 bifunctional phosphopantothenoylcysteine decarboxylase/phosphopantothenate--cysteine ligase CoaBC [Methanoregulaceae archaeon]HRY75900.1 bifunctional phosphopantothenoylcysteine decarboxylase/phosphopantothenate--cysteine ligase CoaBC [Methanoregulaceae archaeon]